MARSCSFADPKRSETDGRQRLLKGSHGEAHARPARLWAATRIWPRMANEDCPPKAKPSLSASRASSSSAPSEPGRLTRMHRSSPVPGRGFLGCEASDTGRVGERLHG